MRYSIIIPTFNLLNYLAQTIDSVQRFTSNYELIIIDNGSSDGTKSYLQALTKRDPRIRCIYNQTNQGFARAINQGLSVAQGDYLIWLNNDVIVTPNWTEQLRNCLMKAGSKLGLERVGLVGPASNLVAGAQWVQKAQYQVDQLEDFAIQFAKANPENWVYTGFLSGFCLMLTRGVFNEVGLLDERFNWGGFEDNDYLLRAQAKGFKAVIAGDTFVHHWGYKTFDFPQFQSLRRGLANRWKFYEKWRNPRSQKLVAAYRVKNGQPWIARSLAQTSKFVDEIVILDDGSNDNYLKDLISEYPKVVRYEKKNRPFDERRDRNEVIEWAKEREADWILSVDSDEIFEDKLDRELVERLMDPPNPAIKAYGFSWYTFWNSEEFYRADGIFGQIKGFRLFKNEPYQAITCGTTEGLHCGNIPQFPSDQSQFTNIRIKHYGYLRREDRYRKFEFYSQLDSEKRPEFIGGDNYTHLISESVTLRRWNEQNRLAVLLLMQDESENLPRYFDHVWALADEIIAVDCGSKDDSRKWAEWYGAKVYDFPLNQNFSAARNFGKNQAKSNWLLQLDVDETVENFAEIQKMMDEDAIGFMFPIYNFRKDRTVLSETIRLFRNRPDIFYTGRVHETIDESLQALNEKPILFSPVRILHLGFLKSAEALDRKLSKYKQLNQLMLTEDPNDFRPYYNLALHYLEEGDRKKGREFLQESIQRNPQFYQSHREMGLEFLAQAREEFQKVLELLPASHSYIPVAKRNLETLESLLSDQQLEVRQ